MKRLASIVAVLALVAAACSGGGGGRTTTSPSGQVKEGGFLKLAGVDGIDSLNPYVGKNADAYAAFQYIYPYLVQFETDEFDYGPDFATSWETSKDGLTWTFHTVPDAKWSDGEPLTAEDVAFTFNTNIKFQDGPTGMTATSLASLVKVEAPDANTAVFHYSRPVPMVLANVQQNAILPEHVWARYATGDGKAITFFPNQPSEGEAVVSGGPFMITEFEQDELAIFEKNPNYYATPAHIDGFALQHFTFEDAMVTALKTGEIDAIETVPTAAVKTLQDAGMNVFVGPALAYRTFIINSSPYKETDPELMDPRVRQAFECAIDRHQIIDTAWLGYAHPGTTVVPPATGKWHDPSIQPLPFDTAKANEILDSLGYQKGSDGIRVANGHPMTYEVLLPPTERRASDRAFPVIQAGFAEIGVNLTPKPVTRTGAYALMTAPDNKYLNWDLAMWNWTPPIDPDFSLATLTCAQFGWWNDSAYCNPAYDALYEQQRAEMDPQKRLEIVHEMQKMIYEDRPYIVLTYDSIIDAWSPGWAGFVQVQGLFSALSKESLTQVHRV